MPNTPKNARSSAESQTLLAGVIVFIASLAALVYLESHGEGTTQLMILCGPVVAALLINGHVTRLTERQNEKIQTVIEQTNGALDVRMLQASLDALAAVASSPAAAPAPDPSEPPSASTMPAAFIRHDDTPPA